MDPMTGLVLAGGLFANKDLVNRLLGPTADYLGKGTQIAVEKAASNLWTIIRCAIEKTGSKIDQQGQVNPRVVKEVWSEGPFIEDEFAAEYFGGLLASARSKDGKDDSSLAQIHLLKGLPSLQIRSHFVIYATFSTLLQRHKSRDSLGNQAIRFSSESLIQSLGFQDAWSAPAELLQALRGLIDQQLLGSYLTFSCADLRFSQGVRMVLQTDSGYCPECEFEVVENDQLNSICLTPSDKGASLFLRALGLKGLHPELIDSIHYETSITKELLGQIRLPNDATLESRLTAQGLASRMDSLEFDKEEIGDQLESLRKDLDELKEQIEDKEQIAV